jgi:hypothetical protein
VKRGLPFFVLFVAIMLVVSAARSARWPQSAIQVAESTQASAPTSGKWYSTKWGQSFRPRNGYVPDQKTAMQVAEAILVSVYGEGQVKAQEPFRVSLDGNIWTVKGALPHGPEGNAEIKLSKKDGAVLYVSHSE